MATTIYAGTSVSTTATFTTSDGSITDPSTITLKYKAGNNSTVTWAYGGAGTVVKVSEGVYTAALDTTALAGQWQVEWIGTGNCAAVSVAVFSVTTPPI